LKSAAAAGAEGKPEAITCQDLGSCLSWAHHRLRNALRTRDLQSYSRGGFIDEVWRQGSPNREVILTDPKENQEDKEEKRIRKWNTFAP
jgi:hypothetical protein